MYTKCIKHTSDNIDDPETTKNWVWHLSLIKNPEITIAYYEAVGYKEVSAKRPYLTLHAVRLECPIPAAL